MFGSVAVTQDCQTILNEGLQHCALDYLLDPLWITASSHCGMNMNIMDLRLASLPPASFLKSI